MLGTIGAHSRERWPPWRTGWQFRLESAPTAVEAAGQAIQNALQQGQTSSSSNGLVPEALAKAIVTAAFEEDAFVAERAGALLPKLLNFGVVDENACENIAKSLADHPEKLESLVGGSSRKSACSAAFGTTANLSRIGQRRKEVAYPRRRKRHRTSSHSTEPFRPNFAQRPIGALIASKDPSMRMAGLRAAIDSLENYRRTSIEAAVRVWRLHADEAIRAGSRRSRRGMKRPTPN